MSELSTAQKRQRLEDSQISIDPSDTVVVMDTSTESSNVAVDPDGDVVLVLNGTELQVSSKVLSVASNVFKAMFSPHFQEGQDLNCSSPKRISLPEDDAIAMTTLCNILHHQSHKVTKKPLPSCLVSIGILCDKYDCSQALELWSRTWFLFYHQNLLLQEPGTPEPSDLLYPFIAFNDGPSFRQISSVVVYRTKGFINKHMVSDLLPVGLGDLLQRKKWEIECQLSIDLATMINPILDCGIKSSATHREGGGRKLSSHLIELRRLGLSPISSAFRSSSILDVCKLLGRYEHKIVGSDYCVCCNIDLERMVKKATRDAVQCFDGLCLGCIKPGTTETVEVRKCLVHKEIAEGSSSAKKVRRE